MAALFLRLISPMAMAQAARSLSSLTICSSNASIFLRQSAMSIVLVPHLDDTWWGLGSCVHLGGDIAGRVGSGAERAHEVADGLRGIGRCGLFDEADDGAAYDRGVGKRGDGAHVLGVGDAEAKCDGEIGELLEAADELFGVGGEFGLSAGDADARDGVDEAARV